MRVPLTQKARGVVAMKLYGPWERFVPEFRIVQKEEHVSGMWISSDYWFGRFCPPRPEHGYIDSRVVKDRNDLLSMLEQTKKVHANSEIMLMMSYAPEDLAGSFVWTPAKVTLGTGNDGATAGKEGCVTLPLVPAQIEKVLLDAAGVPEDQSPYVEGLVTYGGTPVLVQLRYGPEPPLAMDYVPQTMRVKKVVKAEGDLMAFAEMVKGLEEGTVVDHVGGSLTSHFGVHCLCNKVPIVTTFKPEVGQRLQQVEQKMPQHDPKAVADWFCFGMRDARSRDWQLDSMGVACNAALWIMHNAAALGEYPNLVGSALAILVKLCTIACHGEARHLSGDPEQGNARTRVFRNRLKNSSDALRTLPRKREMFEAMGTERTGVGGQPWAHCATVTIQLFEMIRELIKNPTHDQLSKVISQANAVVNEAHNGGWWLNKFTTEDVFDACSVGAPHAVAYAMLGIQGILVTGSQTKKNVWSRVVGFKRKELLGLPDLESRGVRLAGSSNTVFLVDPRTRKLCASGKRIGWMLDAPPQMVEDVLSGAVLPILYRNGIGPVQDGDVVKVIAMQSEHRLRGEPRQYEFVWRDVEVFDARDAQDIVNEYTFKYTNANYFAPLSGEMRQALCEMCFGVVPTTQSVPDPFLCTTCGGEQPKRLLCSVCGESGATLRNNGAPGQVGGNLCWKCAWEALKAQNKILLAANNEVAARKIAKLTALRIMCEAPDCHMTVQLTPGREHYRCGCTASCNSVSLTLEKLKGLYAGEQEKQKA